VSFTHFAACSLLLVFPHSGEAADFPADQTHSRGAIWTEALGAVKGKEALASLHETAGGGGWLKGIMKV